MLAKVQTHWAKNAETGLFWLNGSAFWRVCPLMMVRCAHAAPLLRALARYSARKPAICSVGGAAHVRISGLTFGHWWQLGTTAHTPLDELTCALVGAGDHLMGSGHPSGPRAW